MRARLLCRVIDNFGDAGVCWRFARQLAREYGWHIRLTIDRPDVLARLGAQAGAVGAGAVTIEPWPKEGHAPGEAHTPQGACAPDETGDIDVLISAFGAEPPPALRASLAGAARRPLWVQLEYLSAEDWVGDCHGLRSPKPSDGAIEHFYYPGFDERSGGLLRERDLPAQRDAFTDSRAQRDWLARLCIPREPGERLATLFCYPLAPVVTWFDVLRAAPTRWRILVPEGVADAAIHGHFGALPAPSSALTDGALTVQRVPFLAQDDYDRLLWSADLNFVRGEDSWIRAHWARRPFVWQPYAQDGDAHLAKLRAFLRRMQAGEIVDRAMLAWSGADDWPASWRSFEAQLDALHPAYDRWIGSLAAQHDLCARFVEFCSERL